MKIDGPWRRRPETQAVMDCLLDGGKQAFFVGGCVRNTLLAVEVADIDIATDATPSETIDLAQAAGLKTVPTGFDHGTVTVVSGGLAHEITSFRKDVATDGRRATVSFSSDICEDARRRDFTMNAIYADKDGMIVDPLSAVPDVQARRVRFIEDPAQRIAEDYLRILRFFRFHAWYGDVDSGLDPAGLAACAEGAQGIVNLSKERIGAEIRKLLDAPDPAPSIAAMAKTGVLPLVLAGSDITHLAPLVHIEGEIGVPPNWIRRLCILGGKDPAQSLRMSRRDQRDLGLMKQALTELNAAKASYRFGREAAIGAALITAASLGQMPGDSLMREIAVGGRAKFPVTASDLMPEFHGAALGKKLVELEQRWIASGFRKTREQLLG